MEGWIICFYYTMKYNLHAKIGRKNETGKPESVMSAAPIWSFWTNNLISIFSKVVQLTYLILFYE